MKQRNYPAATPSVVKNNATTNWTDQNLHAALIDFANLYLNEKSLPRFRDRWPGFLPKTPWAYLRHRRDNTVDVTSKTGEIVKVRIADEFDAIIALRDLVRRLWKGRPEKADLQELAHIMLVGSLGAVEPAADTQWTSETKTPHDALLGVITIDWVHRKFVYRPQTVFQKALHYLLLHADKAKTCANPDCQAPYFIAERRNTRYCMEDCANLMQAQAKVSWWAEKGKNWREQRRTKNSTRKKGKTV